MSEADRNKLVLTGVDKMDFAETLTEEAEGLDSSELGVCIAIRGHKIFVEVEFLGEDTPPDCEMEIPLDKVLPLTGVGQMEGNFTLSADPDNNEIIVDGIEEIRIELKDLLEVLGCIVDRSKAA